MLRSSGLVIKLSKSFDYFIFLTIVSFLAVVLAYLDDIQIRYVILIAFVLICHLFRVSKSMLPHLELRTISYTGSDWLLKFDDGEIHYYPQINIRLDTGFFCVIAFCKQHKTKNIVIFYDQITDEARRLIHVLEKVGNNA